MKLLKMQNVYKLILFLFVPLNLMAQSNPVIFDKTNFALINSNFAVRLAAEKTAQNRANELKGNLDKVNENYTKLIVAKNVVSDALGNVNSALKNSLAVREMGNIIVDIYSNSRYLLEIGAKYPLYSHIAKVHMENAILQALALEKDISNIALKGKEHNILMNYHYRDVIIRDVYIRLKLINSGLLMASQSIEQAAKLGFLKGATPFGDWINSDVRIANEIINRAKNL